MPLEDDLRDWARQVVDRAGGFVVSWMRRDVPVRTGNLQDSIEDPDPWDDGNVLGVTVRAAAEYADETDERSSHPGWFSDNANAWEEALQQAAEEA